MKTEDLEKLKSWFYDYVAKFYTEDEFVNESLKLKETHTERVCREISLLTEALGLSDEQKITAEAIGLLHDLGRFEQFIQYGTYNDHVTVSHSELGLKILREKKILDSLDAEEKKQIETAIGLHGKKVLPAGLDETDELFSKIIRDADKLDIYFVMIDKVQEYRDKPEKYAVSLGVPDSKDYSKEILEAVLKNEKIGYKNMKSLNDMILVQMGWVGDINFVETLKIIKHRRLLEKMAKLLPKKPEIKKVVNHVRDFLEARIAES